MVIGDRERQESRTPMLACVAAHWAQTKHSGQFGPYLQLHILWSRISLLF